MANVTAHMPIIKIFVPSSPNKRANASLAEATILPLSQPILTMHNKSNNKKTHDISQKLTSKILLSVGWALRQMEKVSPFISTRSRMRQHNRNRMEQHTDRIKRLHRKPKRCSKKNMGGRYKRRRALESGPWCRA